MKNKRSQLTGAVDARYRALLELSSLAASDPNLEHVIDKTFTMLSRLIPPGLISLLLLDDKSDAIRLHFLKTGSKHPPVDIGTAFDLKGSAIWQAIDEQRAVLVEDGRAEINRFPEVSALLRDEPISSFYVFPISTARKRLGALIVATYASSFSEDDAGFLASVASHVSVVLDGALAFESASEYHRELARERDRLKLLLEINNHVVSQLEINDFFRAASASIRRFFKIDGTCFWLLDEKSNQLKSVVLDFPSRRSPLTLVDIVDVTEERMERLRNRTPFIEDEFEIERKFPPAGAAILRSEGIIRVATLPLFGRNGPIAALTLGSRRPNAFSQDDVRILAQVATQISLALDNSLAYERLNASRNHLEDQRVYLESEIVSESGFEDIIGKSKALHKVLNQVAIVARTDSTVIIHGETGTGKELIARAIHARSSRASNTFVRLNCAAIPSGLLESELFGHERGAFTGALMQKRGRFELADHGSLFLDEIGDISLDLQPKLLRAIQEHEFERLGSTRTIHVDVRLVAATHKDLRKMILEGTFREDLFYRLNVFPIEVPPLRERPEDIPLLVHHFISRLCRRMRKSITSVPRETMDALMAWDWPGNVRELENFIERAVILTPGDTLNAPMAELTAATKRITPLMSFRESERSAILAALKATNGKVAGKNGAAERLGLKRTTLRNKMRKLGISIERSTNIQSSS